MKASKIDPTPPNSSASAATQRRREIRRTPRDFRPLRLENIGFGATVFAMAVAALAVLAMPTLADIGTHIAAWKHSWALMAASAGHTFGLVV